MKQKKFQKRKEDFTCEHCGVEVIGTGYTNHCPECLWSKHVDVNPGDRAETCSGMMEPIRVETERGVHILVHKCVQCEHEKRNKVSPDDNHDMVVVVAEKHIDR